MPFYRKQIEWAGVFYQRNVDLGIAPKCHECVSHTHDKLGYTVFKRDGFYLMHRWVWWKATGETPDVVMHKCDNPCCINLEHLCAGTVKENNRDRDGKGRSGTAGQRWKRALADTEVRDVRELAKHTTRKSTAASMGVSKSVIDRIIDGATYTDVK